MVDTSKAAPIPDRSYRQCPSSLDADRSRHKQPSAQRSPPPAAEMNSIADDLISAGAQVSYTIEIDVSKPGALPPGTH